MLKYDKQNLRRFGITMAIAFLLITFFILLKHKHSVVPTALAAVFFLMSGIITPISLKPIYILWMKLALVLSWINTRLILFVMFYLIFTPIGLAIKLFGVDLLDRKIDKNKDSYWKKEELTLSDYERQF